MAGFSNPALIVQPAISKTTLVVSPSKFLSPKLPGQAGPCFLVLLASKFVLVRIKSLFKCLRVFDPSLNSALNFLAAIASTSLFRL